MTILIDLLWSSTNNSITLSSHHYTAQGKVITLYDYKNIYKSGCLTLLTAIFVQSDNKKKFFYIMWKEKLSDSIHSILLFF